MSSGDFKLWKQNQFSILKSGSINGSEYLNFVLVESSISAFIQTNKTTIDKGSPIDPAGNSNKPRDTKDFNGVFLYVLNSFDICIAYWLLFNGHYLMDMLEKKMDKQI